jgi:hypothetical protein
MVRTLWLLVPAALLLPAACSRTVDACPEHMVREGDHCVSEDPSLPGEALPIDPGEPSFTPERDSAAGNEPNRDGGALEMPPPTLDSGVDARPPMSDASYDMDASIFADARAPDTMEGGLIPYDAYAGDAGLDASIDAADGAAAEASTADVFSPSDALVSNEASLDASYAADAEDASPDGSDADASHTVSDGGDAAIPPLCSDSDLANWRTFQISGRLIQTIAACYASDPRCARGACDLAGCLRQSAGIAGCVDCVAEETRCALAACTSSCGSSDTSDACRACACAQGCIGGTTACGMGPANVCADCRGGTCNNMSLDPALIMVIIDSAW